MRLLSIQSNRIVKLEGLDKLTKLEELYISHNGVKELGGLEHNVRAPMASRADTIRSICACSTSATTPSRASPTSRISASSPSSGCVRDLPAPLTVQASNNQLAEFADIESQLAGLSQLETVYLEGNPLQRDLAAAYRRRVMLALPQVKQIDATCVAHRRHSLTLSSFVRQS